LDKPGDIKKNPMDRISRYLLLAMVIIAVTAFVLRGYIPGTARRDQNGFPHGTGRLETFYPSGPLRLSESILNGEPVTSVWYRPDGSVFAKTDWQAGTGTGYELYDDGSLQLVIPFQDGLAEGVAIEYEPDGREKRRKQYQKGQSVKEVNSSP
jgi:antitoxin component YwqK of YwqJK toxin-antitoxin module